jgi:hypothetical protein
MVLEHTSRLRLTTLFRHSRLARLSLEAIMLALRLEALGAFRPFSQVFDLTSGPIVQGWVA